MAKNTATRRIQLFRSEEEEGEDWTPNQEEGERTAEAAREEKQSTQTDTIQVDDVGVKKRGRPKGSTNKAKIPTLTEAASSLSLAQMTLGLTNSTVVAMFGPECQLMENEKALLFPPLSRVINRLPAADAAKAAVFVDPLVLLFGLAIWAKRIISLKSEERERANRLEDTERLRSIGIEPNLLQRDVPPRANSESPPVRDRIVPDIRQNGGSFTSDSAPTGGIPSQILESFPDGLESV